MTLVLYRDGLLLQTTPTTKFLSIKCSCTLLYQLDCHHLTLSDNILIFCVTFGKLVYGKCWFKHAFLPPCFQRRSCQTET